MKNNFVRIVIFGFVIWLVPFVISFAFYDPSGNLAVNENFFKSLMIVVSALVSSYLLVRYFRNIHQDFVRQGLVTGIVWLIINLLLDVLILIPMSGMTAQAYFFSIGLRYLQIPVIGVMAGVLLNNRYTLK